MGITYRQITGVIEKAAKVKGREEKKTVGSLAGRGGFRKPFTTGLPNDRSAHSKSINGYLVTFFTLGFNYQNTERSIRLC